MTLGKSLNVSEPQFLYSGMIISIFYISLLCRLNKIMVIGSLAVFGLKEALKKCELFLSPRFPNLFTTFSSLQSIFYKKKKIFNQSTNKLSMGTFYNFHRRKYAYFLAWNPRLFAVFLASSAHDSKLISIPQTCEVFS